MIKLDKTKSYYLGDLSKEQKQELLGYLQKEEPNECWTYFILNTKYLYYDNEWLESHNEIHNRLELNALELFYTLENVQVDCRELSEEQIKEMCRVYENNGYKLLSNKYNNALVVSGENISLRLNISNEIAVLFIREEKHTITYDKFMELFSKEENVLTEIMKDEYKPTFCETYKSEKPQHYSKGIDTFKRMEENCTLEERLAFAKGNIDKYTWRTKGQDKEDFVKIVKYAEWAIKQLENEQSTK